MRMTAAGWYPDPSGAPSSFRYWDGQTWTEHTSSSPSGQSGPTPTPPPTPPPAPPATPPTWTPSGPPPGQPPTQPPAYPSAGGYGQGGSGWATGGGDVGYGVPATGPAPSGSGARIAMVVGAVVAVLALAVGTFFTVRALTGDDTPSADDETSQSSEPSESDDPTDDPTDEPTDEPTEPSPSASVPVEPTGRECTGGLPAEGGQPPSGGGLSGGGLSLAQPPGFNPLAVESAFAFADGVATVVRQIEPQWIAVYALGSITKANGFTTPEQAADVVLTCMTESDQFYRSFTGRTDLASEPVTVAGAEAWALTAEVRVDDPEVTVEGDVATVVVVETGDPTSFGLFVSVVPIGDQALFDQQIQAVSGLMLN